MVTACIACGTVEGVGVLFVYHDPPEPMDPDIRPVCVKCMPERAREKRQR